MNRQRKFVRNNRGAAAIEFRMVVILLSAVAIFSTLEMRDQVSTTVTDMVWNLKAS